MKNRLFKRLHFMVISRKQLVIIFTVVSCVLLALFIVARLRIERDVENFKALPTYYGVVDAGFPRYGYNGGKLAIIIDDFGQSRDGVKKMMSIKRHLTFAVMPFVDYSLADAEDGNGKGYEIIVHLAMEPEKGKLSWLGPRPILSGMNLDKVKNIVRDSFESIPHAKGANIHMGSKASSEVPIVSSILEIMSEKKLYFVDSLTSYHPVAKKIADEKGVICFERNIFLDGTKSKVHIKKQLQKAMDIALKIGQAVAIGHVGIEGGDATAEAISEMLPEFDRNKVELAFISELQQ